MNYFEGKSIVQIAKELNITKQVASKTLIRAKNNLKKIKKFM